MARIKVGDKVRAHLDAAYKGRVTSITSEKHIEYTSAGPMVKIVYCIVELEDGRIVKTKVTDLYVDYD